MTRTICVYLFGSEPEIRAKLAGKLGKKGTASDIRLYSYSKDFVIEVVDPIQFPQKKLSLYQTALMTDVPIILIPLSGPDVYTGEFALLLEALKFRNGIIIIAHEDEYVNVNEIKEKIQKIFTKLEISKFPILDINFSDGESLLKLKELICLQAEKRPIYSFSPQEDISRIDVDHIFPVTGVGTVILGRIRAGQLKRTEKLFVFPSKRTCIVRSIQISDVEQNSANVGDRVGLALRGLLPKDVERGFILSNSDKWEIKKRLRVRLTALPYSKIPEKGKTRHIIIGLQCVLATVVDIEKISETESKYWVDLELDEEITFTFDEAAYLVDLNNKPSTIGFCEIKE